TIAFSLRSKNSEKRKEKSRDAARCRRSKESEIFSELSQQLPLAEGVTSQLDKASVMRLAISYLRMHEILEPIVELKEEKVSSAYDASVLEALDGFLVVLSADGDVLFLSENISRHLGLNQVDLMGQSLFEFCHPCDHDELKEVLCPGGAAKAPESGEELPQPCSFFVRLRCALGSKGRGVGVKSASSYKVLHCVGHRPPEPSEASPEPCGQAPAKEQRRFLVCVAQPIPHPSNIEVPLGSRTFLSRHSPSMRFTHAKEAHKTIIKHASFCAWLRDIVLIEQLCLFPFLRIEKFLGYTSDELLGKSVYSYFDARDISALQKDFKT
ncbi:hypoxia-inducible factor 1 alpha, putative, partial [Ixodes scapularis]